MKKEETVDMLPCPFCGGDVSINERGSGRFEVGCDKPYCYGWSCNDPRCRCEDGYTSKESAINMWNKRAYKPHKKKR